MVTESIIQELEVLYQKLMTKAMTPDEEAQAKAQLLGILSSVKAHAEIRQGNRAREALSQTNNLKELLLDWDPYGSAWFKEEKTLVNSVYNLLAAIKALFIEKPATADTAVINSLQQQINELSGVLGAEIANIKNELASVKSSVIKLATAVKNQLNNRPAPQVAPAPKPMPATRIVEQKPVSLEHAPSLNQRTLEPKPISIPKAELENLTPKPITLPKPVPISLEPEKSTGVPRPFQSSRPTPNVVPKPEPVVRSTPKPQLIPLDEMPGPSPIPITDPEFDEPIPLGDSNVLNNQFFGGSPSLTKNSESPDKAQLFNIFSTGGGSSSEPELELEISTGSTSRSMQVGSNTTSSPIADAETLYQELISLEGKRYSIERNIRDLKSDRENGVLSDQDYKGRLSQLLNNLQTISKRIDVIRETLD
ncbi:MAG: hypothetical protein EU536_02340 [Promethearchaeota archaeon]|nr:MAG: hypothetical protein EU536_02340 [Candidatus Lokiarchaeota archaeon]